MNLRCVEITQVEETLKSAEAACSEAIVRIQDGCEHPIILERPAGMSEYQYIENHWNYAVRVCARCGYAEEADHWPTPRTKETPLFNTVPKSKSVLNRKDFEIGQDRLYKEIVRRS